MSSLPALAKPKPADARPQVVFQIVALVLLLVLLVNYKGAAGLGKIQQTRASGSLHLVKLQSPGTSSFSNAIGYLKIVWPALIFGILISAAVRTSLSRTPLHRMFQGSVVRDQVAATLVGAPLMLCSCCVASIFPAVYQRTQKVAPALGVTLASPSLNPAALTLTFMLFPLRISALRLAMALLLVLVGSVLVARIAQTPILIRPSTPERNEVTWMALLASYTKSLAYISLRVVPLILLGIWASMWVISRFSVTGALSGARVLSIVMIAFFAVLLTLPSLFEIPLALSVLAAGGSPGAAAALLFAGPAINLPSLLVIGSYSNWKVAVSLALLVWGIAVAGALCLR